MSSESQPQASTSKEGAGPRTSFATTTYYNDAPTPEIDHSELRSIVSVPQHTAGGGNGSALSSNLAKLQTYLPTGTWVTYTALETWAFSLRPGDPPSSPITNCNTQQRVALIIVLSLSTFMAFFASFVKQFVYDAQGKHVLFPTPNIFCVTHKVTDPITGVRFPCKTKEGRYCWPLVNDAGELMYDEKKIRLRVLVLKLGIKVHVKRKIWIKRIWDSLFHEEETVPIAPRLSTSASTKHNSVSTFLNDAAVEIDEILATAPELQPRWRHTLQGALGSKSYLDLSLCVWAHAFVSVIAFLTLALFSTQVTGCLYPSIPDYLPSTLQTGMLFLLGVIAAVFIRDNAVSLGQVAPQHMSISERGGGGAVEVPVYLRNVVEILVWMGRVDAVFGDKAAKDG